MPNVLHDKFLGCLAGGAVGDAIGSLYETQTYISDIDFNYIHGITDDTQLTMATCEAIIDSPVLTPDAVAQAMLKWYNKGILRGLGSSTLSALRALQVGAHWALAGRSGEYAAGNGAAMRIAPLAFILDVSAQRQLIRDICYITHKNEEAYVGAISVLYALQNILREGKPATTNLIAPIIDHIPDTKVKDSLLLLAERPHYKLPIAAELIGTSGYVACSVPFSIFAAQQITHMDFLTAMKGIMQCGGDTDTNAAIAGQLMGAAIGYNALPPEIKTAFRKIPESSYIFELAEKMKTKCLL
ncbi:ADP-ribosylglycohydrolase family protein [Chitinophaga sp. Hz27]|uniref:ADP-ribosylglycohydrolase family protein n=1 Tax=Chitinophaga sp. Hz27 TaxID=3347169 RepID=UPI0035DA824B